MIVQFERDRKEKEENVSSSSAFYFTWHVTFLSFQSNTYQWNKINLIKTNNTLENSETDNSSSKLFSSNSRIILFSLYSIISDDSFENQLIFLYLLLLFTFFAWIRFFYFTSITVILSSTDFCWCFEKVEFEKCDWPSSLFIFFCFNSNKIYFL